MLRDLRLAVRQLLKSKGFTFTAILMLTLGIGATTAIFSVVEGVLLRPLPFPQPQRLVALSDVLQGINVGDGTVSGVTGPDVVAYTRYTHSFASLGGYGTTSYELSGIGEPAEVNAARLTASVFPTLGIQPLLGRVFTAQEDQQHQQVAVLSYAAWQKHFNGDAQVLGKKILLDRKPYIVIGVMPREFQFPLTAGHAGNQAELWVPMSFTAEDLGIGAGSWNYKLVGRLKPGVTAAQAQDDAQRVAKQITSNLPAWLSSVRISAAVQPLRQDIAAQAAPLLRTLFLAVAVVLLIACFNLAGLLLVRAIRRRRELAVRLAIGARAPALLRQTMLESLVLSVAGGLLGLALAAATLRTAVNFLPDTLPRLDDISIDWRVALFALSVALLTGLLCGLAPGFAALHTDVNRALREGGRTGTAGGVHARLRSALVIAEIAIALVLLCASGLLLRSFQNMRDVNLGFHPDHTLTADYDLPKQQYTSQAQIDSFNQQMLERLRQLPGVEEVGTATEMPVSADFGTRAFVVEGYVPPKDAPFTLGWSSSLLGNYFRAMDIPLLRGRRFNDADRANTQLVVIVNKTMAHHFWPGQDPIGRRIRWGLKESPTPWLTVVGEVGDVKQTSPDEPTADEIYQPASQESASWGSMASQFGDTLSANSGTIVLRTAVEPQLMENSLLAVVRSIDPQLPLQHMQTMDHVLSTTEAPRRFNTVLISSFAAAALLLAILGIYSVIAFTVAQRAPEMAIRMALGSQRSEIRGIIFMSAAKLALVGCVLGLGGAAAASMLLRSFLFGVSPFDPLVLALAALAVLLLAVLASLLPAQRAAAVDPILALRSE